MTILSDKDSRTGNSLRPFKNRGRLQHHSRSARAPRHRERRRPRSATNPKREAPLPPASKPAPFATPKITKITIPPTISSHAVLLATAEPGKTDNRGLPEGLAPQRQPKVLPNLTKITMEWNDMAFHSKPEGRRRGVPATFRPSIAATSDFSHESPQARFAAKEKVSLINRNNPLRLSGPTLNSTPRERPVRATFLPHLRFHRINLIYRINSKPSSAKQFASPHSSHAKRPGKPRQRTKDFPRRSPATSSFAVFVPCRSPKALRDPLYCSLFKSASPRGNCPCTCTRLPSPVLIPLAHGV